ncbi:MAG: type II toxin-antitoxin system RelE/ParE family toxin, partial [Planctomycetota bacterium]
MKYDVKIHPGAIEDIKRNSQWWAESHSETQALAWYEHAIASLAKLEQMPSRHGLSFENKDFSYEIRDLLFGLGPRPSYRAVFTIVENTVHVLTIQRSSQDTL